MHTVTNKWAMDGQVQFMRIQVLSSSPGAILILSAVPGYCTASLTPGMVDTGTGTAVTLACGSKLFMGKCL